MYDLNRVQLRPLQILVLYRILQCKEKIKKLKAWKGKVAASTPEFEEELEEALYIFNSLFEILRDDRRFFG